jgi:hypothetical protein
VCAVSRAVVEDSFFNCWCLEISSDNEEERKYQPLEAVTRTLKVRSGELSCV